MTLIGIAVVIAVISAASAFGIWRRRVDGRFKEQPPAVAAAERLTFQQLGHPLGRVATLVQFSSSFCAPCRATRQTLERVAGTVPGVEYAEIDTESNLDLARALKIMRTPTVFVLSADGMVRHRASGQPRYADVVAALGKVIPLDQSGELTHKLDPEIKQAGSSS